MEKYRMEAVRAVAYDVLRNMSIYDMVEYVDIEKYLDLLRSIDCSAALAIANNLKKEELLNMLADEIGYEEANKRLKEWENE